MTKKKPKPRKQRQTDDRTEFYSMRLSTEEREWFQEQAELNGTNVAAWIRMTLREKIRGGTESIVIPLTDAQRKEYLISAGMAGQDLTTWILGACKTRAMESMPMPPMHGSPLTKEPMVLPKT